MSGDLGQDGFQPGPGLPGVNSDIPNRLDANFQPGPAFDEESPGRKILLILAAANLPGAEPQAAEPPYHRDGPKRQNHYQTQPRLRK